MNKLLKNSIIAASTIAIIGCITGTVSDDSVCIAHPITFNIPAFPTPPANSICTQLPDVSMPPVSTTTTINFASDIDKITDGGLAAQLSLAIKSLTIDNSQGDFDWVHSVDISVSSQSLPQADLATYTMNGTASSELDIAINMSAADVVRYLEDGPNTLTITLSSDTIPACTAQTLATMGGTLNSSIDMCVSASVSFNKKL